MLLKIFARSHIFFYYLSKIY